MQKLIAQLKEFASDLRQDHFYWASDVRQEGVTQAQEYVCRQVMISIKDCITKSNSKEQVISWMVGLFRALQNKIVKSEGNYKVAYKEMVQRMKPLIRNPEIFKQERIIRIIGYKDR